MKNIAGKTYSLFGDDATSNDYFETVRKLTDFHLEKFFYKEESLLEVIRLTEKKIKIKNRQQKIADIRELIRENLKQLLSPYTSGIKAHVKGLSLFQRFDATLQTKEYQYHLYMIEIELVSRINRDNFLKADFKMALFPHCLSDFRPRCLSEAGDIEHVCMGCTKDCHINLGSKLLKKYGIEPYISATMDQRRLFKELKNQHPKLGVLGIACIPELARGLRLCHSLGIPAIGIPLDVNRCARWMGRAQETSFNFKKLMKLLE
ncbi:DUF116 domain-containing protein [candidate division KSB1 bacterium]|nr:DUF116 domain-containing protein [candidate division KSB1 bacterium]